MTNEADEATFTTKVSQMPLAAYFDLLRKNRNYRLYLVSHMCQHAGDWFVRIAALVSVRRLTQGSSTALSILVMCKTLPEVLFTPFGGMIADRFDRKKAMMRLDIIAGFVVMSYILAVRSENVHYLYLATIARSIIQAFYDPTTKSITPMIVIDAQDLKRAATLSGMIWSGMLVMGGVISGYASAIIGVEACYMFDSITYFISAIIISKVKGDFMAKSNKNHDMNERNIGKKVIAQHWRNVIINPSCIALRMGKELFKYLFSCGFGTLIFLKASGTLIWGPADVLNVSFSHVEGDEAESARRIGIIYSCIGIGCLIGPIVANSTFVDGNKPYTMQIACIAAMAFMSIGWFGIANATSFNVICAFTAFRTMGSALIWLNSTLLLQTLAPNEMLGRVLGLEYSCARCTEAVIAYIAGRLEDKEYGKYEIASLASSIGATLFFLWTIFHVSGGGAANKKLDTATHKDRLFQTPV